VKYAIPAIVVSLLIAAGCQQQATTKPMTDSAALDVTPASTPVAYNAPAPVQTATPDPALAPAASSAGAISGNSYTIQKGDTLWKIATARYGDGRKWHEIADANPGLSPSALHVGETITLP
jgi:5'-nucleotidase / UDP-sugar diphosphatase